MKLFMLNVVEYIANLGNLLLILVPAICHEDGNPFGDHEVCSSVGLSYVSFSMAVMKLLISLMM